MKHFNVLLLIVFLFSACNSATDTNTNPPPPPPPEKIATYPVLPMEEVSMLSSKCDYIDYLFYQLPVSMSFHDPASVRSALGYIDANPAPLKPNCKSIGRVAFQSQGEIIMEAEMYFADGCAQYVFLKDNKPTYGNLMHPNGIKFFTDLIKRATAVKPQ